MAKGTRNKSTKNDIQGLHRVITNALSLRRQSIDSLLNVKRDLNEECGWPDEIPTEEYRKTYDREGIGTRIVNILPEKCWKMDPQVSEGLDSEETAFETAFEELVKDHNLWHYLSRVDKLSGIGNFGILLLGVDDGKTFADPVEGIDKNGDKEGSSTHTLLYLRPCDHTQVSIVSYEPDQYCKRYCQPLMYAVTLPDGSQIGSNTGDGAVTTLRVHWSRIIHVADNRESSEVFG
ncbi:unnamed protein product, partial [marine sediment metagenome]